jgi:general stress protein YciG
VTGTVSGGLRAAQTNKKLYGANFYRTIGRMGGLKSRGGGFSKDTDLARVAGRKGGQQRRKQTRCKRGHVFNESNTYVDPSGGRQCKTCNRLRSRGLLVPVGSMAGYPLPYEGIDYDE